MSDVVVSQKLAVAATMKEGISIGAKNIGPILVNVLLWILTIWIPYINVGTTIGLSAGIVSKASRGEVIPMTEIFDRKYRKYMGEYFLVAGFVTIGVCIGTVFGVIPGIVIGIAWSLAILLVVDKGKNPTEAITLSNNLTYGYKGKIIGIYLLTSLVISIVAFILITIGSLISTATNNDGVMSVVYFLNVLLAIFSIFVFIGLQASIYKQLADS